MHVTRIDAAGPYEAPKHFDMRALRLQGFDASPSENFWVGLSHFLPGGGAQSDATPLENADLIGLDLTLDIHRQVLPHIDRTPGPATYLREMVDAGQLGIKTGEGFHRWAPEDAEAVRVRLRTHLQKVTEKSACRPSVG
jgi:hypothetical protein